MHLCKDCKHHKASISSWTFDQCMRPDPEDINPVNGERFTKWCYKEREPRPDVYHDTRCGISARYFEEA